MVTKGKSKAPPARKKTTVAGKATARKRKIAAGKALGKPHKTIAGESGAALRTVEDFGRAGTPAKVEAEMAMIHQFGQRHADKLDQLYAEAIESCRKDFSDQEGGVRATARGQAIAMIQASDSYRAPPEEKDASQGQYTLTELLVSFHRSQVKAGGDG